jgi:hypothetical protein
MLSGCLTLCCDLLPPAASGQLVVASPIGVKQMHILDVLLHVVCLKPYSVVIVLPGLLQYLDKVITPYACGITVWTEQLQEQDIGFQMPPDAWALHITVNPALQNSVLVLKAWQVLLGPHGGGHCAKNKLDVSLGRHWL